MVKRILFVLVAALSLNQVAFGAHVVQPTSAALAQGEETTASMMQPVLCEFGLPSAQTQQVAPPKEDWCDGTSLSPSGVQRTSVQHRCAMQQESVCAQRLRMVAHYGEVSRFAP